MRRNATLFVLISMFSGFGSTAMTLAAGIWILDLTGSVGLAALVGVCIYAPTLAAPWLGALVDRVPRRPLLIGVDLLLGLALFTLLAVRSAGGVWLIFVVLLARGVSYVLLDAGETAILPAALPPELLGDVNGWRSSAQEGMKLVAPLAGAGLYAWRGALPVILVGATMPLITAGCYVLLRVRPATASAAPPVGASTGFPVASPAMASAASAVADLPGTSAGEQAGVTTASPVVGASSDEGGPGDEAGPQGVRAGLQVLLRERGMRVPVLVAAVAITLSGVTNAAVLSRVVHGLGLPATHLGFLAAGQGAGSILGGLVVGRLLSRFAPAGVAGIGAVVFAAGCAAWCLPWWPGMVAGSVVVGLGLPWTLIAAVTAVQTGTPDHLLGRVGATSTMLMFGPIALAIPLGSALVQLGARPPLLAVVAVAAATGAWALRRRRADRAPVV